MSKVVPFRQIDVTRAIRAVTAAGHEPGEAVISPDGCIIIRIGRPEPAPPAAVTALDTWRSRRVASRQS